MRLASIAAVTLLVIALARSIGSALAAGSAVDAREAIGSGDQPARPLSERGEQNLVAFARLLGYVRHFHPSDEAASCDWDAFGIAGVDEVEGARTAAELAARLRALFSPLAPTLRVDTRPIPPLDPARLRRASPGNTRVLGWWHHGWNGRATRSFYYSRRISAPLDAPGDSVLPVGAEVNVPLADGVWCSVPLTLYADDRSSLPRGSGVPFANRRPSAWSPSGSDRATRLAGAVLFWNVAQHFYPYFDVIGTDWSAWLPIALRRAAQDPDGAAFEKTLQRMVAALHDGHGGVASRYSNRTPMRIAWAFVEGRLVVLDADSSLADRVRRGDEVVAIHGRPVAAWVTEAESSRSAATPQYLRVRTAQALHVLPGVDTLTLDLRSRAGEARRVRVARDAPALRRSPRPDSVTVLRPGVVYLDLDRITDADFQRMLPELSAARGLIFDLRGYPRRLSTVVLSHLIDSTITCARWNVPVVRRPDRRDLAFAFSNWEVEPRAPRLRGRAAFLIDGSAISYAETYLGMVEHYRLAELVGEPTAGTNGNMAFVRLPGGFDVSFTGMKVLKHDGSRHHGVGILPTVLVSPTIAGIAAGRDEPLERALEVVSK